MKYNLHEKNKKNIFFFLVREMSEFTYDKLETSLPHVARKTTINLKNILFFDGDNLRVSQSFPIEPNQTVASSIIIPDTFAQDVSFAGITNSLYVSQPVAQNGTLNVKISSKLRTLVLKNSIVAKRVKSKK